MTPPSGVWMQLDRQVFQHEQDLGDIWLVFSHGTNLLGSVG